MRNWTSCQRESCLNPSASTQACMDSALRPCWSAPHWAVLKPTGHESVEADSVLFNMFVFRYKIRSKGRRYTVSTSSKILKKFCRRMFAKSCSVQFLRSNSWIKAGYFDTSSNPFGKLKEETQKSVHLMGVVPFDLVLTSQHLQSHYQFLCSLHQWPS